MITYNHEHFVGEAIFGVLNQECSYDIELVITDDCSTDNTEAVINSFKSHPKGNTIKYIRQYENIGILNNLIGNLENCQGDYLAFCEGDDYWTDPLKLEKQIGIMEANQDVVLTFTSRIIQDANFVETSSICQNRFWTKNDIYAYGSVFPTQTKVGRNYQKELITFISLFPDSFGFDKIIGYFYCLKGQVQSIEDITAVYRHNGLGVWSQFSNEEKVVLHIDQSLQFLTTISREKIDQSVSLEELKELLFVRIINNNLGDAKFLKLLFKKYNLSNKLKLILIRQKGKLAIKTAIKTLYK
ncbi:glycosyltransferase [Flavobacterium sp. F-380]|uniref:Glycosyltransferase n=1 Tax=Flavobacterium kayseriense TaxID=2764714 RepID=A0ABR7J7R0_9FLAO|nr:glycosyltransferase [Flavobacterium kayseriense]MBC5841476.1 glycosyltransferase [Flavobacterium kayseriense]MBC5848004.1 glycosyltransferase [Flavobacterium kayseriense]